MNVALTAVAERRVHLDDVLSVPYEHHGEVRVRVSTSGHNKAFAALRGRADFVVVAGSTTLHLYPRASELRAIAAGFIEAANRLENES